MLFSELAAPAALFIAADSCTVLAAMVSFCIWINTPEDMITVMKKIPFTTRQPRKFFRSSTAAKKLKISRIGTSVSIDTTEFASSLGKLASSRKA